ncbi:MULTISPECIES: rhomboid family intramembrane serine protease [Haloferax]|uniref:Rhomboid family intramembrane serine protease n=1 Tax=Haloferax marinum TaxID=2666143 RepID=A0A6A8G712_9EURY|nr:MULTISPECIES: rhomboid family intramembrane serine protease [Haloferax]KAB1197047.1 rhomboid family intramembrane serine protease [Haloferax sp. CBA1150]MRW96073.1 rhomboid family intramembrane serine protease [Haloferax marinum]
MAICDVCGKDESLPYSCSRCGGTFCSEHRLPENHNCTGLAEWNDPSGVFESDFDSSAGTSRGRAKGALDSLTGTGGVLGYFRGNVSYLFLAIMWVTFLLEWVVLLVTNSSVLFSALFTLSSENPLYVWTWVTSVFSHNPFSFYHIVGNSIVLYFFGPPVERYIGSQKFAALFIGAGVLAGLSHIGSALILTPGVPTSVLGASGAVFAVLGVLTVLNPNLRIYLYFLIPIPLWLFTFGFAALSVVFFLAPGAAATAGQGNVAHFAHLVGLVIGLAYGQRVKGKQRVPSEMSLGGGMRRGPGGGRF